MRTPAAGSPAVVSVSGLIALAVAMGIGRFAFTPLIPMMQADAGLSLEQGGWLASANYAGYLAGALWAGRHPVRGDFAIRGGLATIALVTAAMGVTNGLAMWAALRFVAGLASAWVLIHVSSWALDKLAQLRRPVLASVVYTGVGIGVMLAGLLCLALMRLELGSGMAWIVLGAVALVLAILVWPVFEPGKQASARRSDHRWDAGWLRLVLCYGAYGFGYIIPATFIPVMARAIVQDPAVFGWAWPLFGAAAALSTLGAGVLLRRMGNRRVWISSHFVMALGVAAPLFWPGIAGILIGSLFVGATFVVVTLVGMQEARVVAGPHAARLMAVMTAAFAAGQIAGPAVASLWISAEGRMADVLWLAALVLLVSGSALIGSSPALERRA
jgi:MFS family permease